MAWAIDLPLDGKFTIGGDCLCFFEGKEVPWEDRLRHAWRHELTEEQKSYTAYHGEEYYYPFQAQNKFSIGARYPDLAGPIWDHEIPHVYVLSHPKQSIQPFSFAQGMDMILHEKALKIWRSLEPEANFAFPLELRTKRGKVYEGPFYGVAVRQLRDALLLDRTSYEAKMLIERPYYKVVDWDTGKGRMAISAQSRGGAHLWRDQRFAYPKLFMSDELREALLAAEIPLHRMYRIEEV